jgi:hypothetical protein
MIYTMLPQDLLDRMARVSMRAPPQAWQLAAGLFGLLGFLSSAELCTGGGCRPTGEPSLLLIAAMLFGCGMWAFNQVIEHQQKDGCAAWRIHLAFWVTMASAMFATVAVVSLAWITLTHIGVPGGATLVVTVFEF